MCILVKTHYNKWKSLIIVDCKTCYLLIVLSYYYCQHLLLLLLYLHPVSITRFPLRRLSPGAGLLRCIFFIGSG